tara:strand:- start:205 stop:2385 length:2181 start_codon:yes stop_codon:yes gene_type:complete
MALSKGQKKQRRKLASLGRAPGLRGDKTRAQKMFYARQATMNQGLGKTGQSLDSQKLGAEATRLTGIPSQPKEGSFNISDAGKIQAERQKSVQGRFMPSNPAYQGVGAYSGPRKYQDRDYLTSTPYVNAFKRTFGADATLKGSRFNPADRAAAQGAGMVDSTVNMINFGKNLATGFQFTDRFNLPTLPRFENENLQKLRNFSSVAIPAAFTGGALKRFNTVDPETKLAGFANEIAKMRLPNKGKYAFSDAPGAFRPKLTAKGIEGVNPSTIVQSIFNPNSLQTGPTAGGSAALLGTATALSAAQQAKATETKSGGLNVGTEKTTTGGDRTSRVLDVVKNVAKFNPLSAIDFATNDRTDLDRLGNLNIAGREIKPYNLVSDAAMVANKVRKGDLTRADVREGISDFTKTATADNKAKAFFKNYDADDFMKSLDVAKESKIVQNQLEKEGFPSDFKKQIANTFEGLKEETSKMEQGKVHNRLLMKTRVDEINNLLANINTNKKLSTLSKIAGQFDPKTNPDAKNMKTLDKIKAGFDPNSPNALALSATDRGIEGSAGNLLIGGKLSDIYKDAATNIPKGQIGLSSEDMFNIAKNTYENLNTPGSLSEKRANEIVNLIDRDKGITPSSLIRGILPRQSGSNRNRFNTPLSQQGSTPQEILEELLINPTPTTPTPAATQTGNLADLQRISYLNALGSYGIDPNLFAQVRQRQGFLPDANAFGNTFNRQYF